MSIFSSISRPKVGRNKFDLSYWNYLTCNMGDVIPFLVQDLVPGDKFRVKSDMFARLMPLATPAFQNLNIYAHYFFIPYRLVWDEWEEFITSSKRDSNGNPVTPIFPYITRGPGQSGTLLEYLGYVHSNSAGGSVYQNMSVLRLRAYWLLYNEWYRDQHVDPEVSVPTSSGYDSANWSSTYPDGTPASSTIAAYPFRKRYGKDYFTSALPYPQLQEVTLPIVAGYGDVVSSGEIPQFVSSANGGSFQGAAEFNFGGGAYATLDNSADVPAKFGPVTGLKADLSSITSATINDLRRAVALQHFYELSARGGNRYIEQMLAHFGVHSKDARLQRPEFLGGGVTPIQIGEVLQTSQTSAGSPQGNLSGRGYAINNKTNDCTYYATEHGILMGVMSIMPESLYWQGIDRHLQKFQPEDYYFPSFAHLGEQEVKKKELFYSGTTEDEETFGYAPRYAEYKHNRNQVHGDFRNTLKQWHFGREFSEAPELNSDFLSVPDITDPFAVQGGDEHKYLFQIRNNIDALRPMPYYSNPKLIG